MPDSVDTLLERVWTHGLFRDQRSLLASLSEQYAGDPRATELQMFAALCSLIDDELPERLPVGETDAAEPSVAVVSAVLRSWDAANRENMTAAADALEQVEAALARAEAALDPHAPRLRAARAWADTAIAECALVAGNVDHAEAVFRRLVRTATTPSGVRVHARLRLALRVGDPMNDPNATIAMLDHAAKTADQVGHPAAGAHARTYAGLFALLSGNASAARLRLSNVAGQDAMGGATRLVAQLLTAELAGEQRVFDELAAALKQAALQGDYQAYVAVLLVGSRHYEQNGDATNAVLTLTQGIAQLTRMGDLGAALAEPLIAARNQLHNRLGEQAYERAVNAALDLLR